MKPQEFQEPGLPMVLAVTLLWLRGKFKLEFDRDPKPGDPLLFYVEQGNERATAAATLTQHLKLANIKTEVLDAIGNGEWSLELEIFIIETLAAAFLDQPAFVELPPGTLDQIKDLGTVDKDKLSKFLSTLLNQITPEEKVLDRFMGLEKPRYVDDSCCLHLVFLDSEELELEAIEKMKAAYILRKVGEYAANGDDIEVIDARTEPQGTDELDVNHWAIHIHGSFAVIEDLLDHMEGELLPPRGTLVVPTNAQAEEHEGEWGEMIVLSEEDRDGSDDEDDDDEADDDHEDDDDDDDQDEEDVEEAPAVDKAVAEMIPRGLALSLRIAPEGGPAFMAKLAAFAHKAGGLMMAHRHKRDEVWFVFQTEKAQEQFVALYMENRGETAVNLMEETTAKKHLMVEPTHHLSHPDRLVYFGEYAQALIILSGVPDDKGGATK
jgi:hypothetical protein